MENECYAYLEKVITDPETAIVQEQIQGNVAKMLIILPDGDQKLIVFDIPLESCTVLTLLEQASIPYNAGTTISLVHDPTSFGINYIVEIQSLITEEETATSTANISTAENCIPSTPKVEEAVYCPGMLAVCPYCGFLSETFHKCQRCKRKLPENAKSVYDRYYKETKKNSFLSEASKKLKNVHKESENPPKIRKLERDNVSFRNSLETEESQSSRDDKVEQKSCRNYSEENVVYEVEDNLVQHEEKEGLGIDNLVFEDTIHIKLACRTVRIGSYKYVPPEDIMISEHGLRLIVPCLEDDKQTVKIDIMFEDIVRVLIHFGRHLPVLFFFTSTRVGERVRNILGMEDPNYRYYDPASKDGTHKRITLLPDTINDDSRRLLKNWFDTKLEELNLTEANEILVRATPKMSPLLKKRRTTRYLLLPENA